jgi:hypothetical protein
MPVWLQLVGFTHQVQKTSSIVLWSHAFRVISIGREGHPQNVAGSHLW